MNRAPGQPNLAVSAGAQKFPALSKAQRAERVAAVRAFNATFKQVSLAVQREFIGIDDWEELSKSKATVVSRITAAIQGVETASDDVLNKATRTVIAEIYAIEEWPTTKRIVLSRTIDAIRRLKLGT